MTFGLLISNDYTFAPGLLSALISEQHRRPAFVVTAPVHSNHRRFGTFVISYLLMLGPRLFVQKAFQTVVNRLRAVWPGGPYSVANIVREQGIPLHTASNVNSERTVSWIRDFQPDVILSLQPQIIRDRLLRVPENGIVNIHPGKLPDYRGPAPLFWALYHREPEIGITAHFMVRQVDAGPLIVQKVLPVPASPSYGTVSTRINRLLPIIMREALEAVEQGRPVLDNPPKAGSYYAYPGLADVWKAFRRRRKGVPDRGDG